MLSVTVEINGRPIYRFEARNVSFEGDKSVYECGYAKYDDSGEVERKSRFYLLHNRQDGALKLAQLLLENAQVEDVDAQ